MLPSFSFPLCEKEKQKESGLTVMKRRFFRCLHLLNFLCYGLCNPHSFDVFLFRRLFIFHAFVLKQKVEPKIQAHSMRYSSLCGKSFGEWAIGPLRNPTARAARLCLEHFHRMAVSRWSPMSTALNFSWGKAGETLKHTSEK